MRCMFWNTRNLCSWGERGKGALDRGKATSKLRLLEEQLEAMRPDVLFLLPRPKTLVCLRSTFK